MKLISKNSWLYLLFGITGYICSSCSISYQNISTHGTATDLVDETQDASPDVDATANLSIPVKPL